MSDLERMDGLFVGQLAPRELENFEDAVRSGKARRWYDGAAGWLGLAKVRLESSDA